MTPLHSQQETLALCQLYRRALAHLLEVIAVSAVLQDPFVHDALAEAETLLDADSTYALAAQRIDQALQDHCYELRDWAYWKLYGRPSTEHGYVPPDHEISRILEDIHALTDERYALDAGRTHEG
jgi:hypothetical protein